MSKRLIAVVVAGLISSTSLAFAQTTDTGGKGTGTSTLAGPAQKKGAETNGGSMSHMKKKHHMMKKSHAM